MDVLLFEKCGDLTNHCVGVLQTNRSLGQVAGLVEELMQGKPCIVQQEGAYIGIRGLSSGEGEELTKNLRSRLSV